jgi:hypothetical protein
MASVSTTTAKETKDYFNSNSRQRSSLWKTGGRDSSSMLLTQQRSRRTLPGMKAQTRETIDHAYEIAGEYRGNLTVRQLYYQLVARGFIPNSTESYKRLVSILTDARLSGAFPFEWLLDRTREARPGRFIGNQVDVGDALRNAADDLRQAPEAWLHRDRWFGQPRHVSVWVEKEALAGVFEAPCNALGVAWFVLRGYSSLSALSQWVDNVAEAYAGGDCIDEVFVIYFGDHDPDGWEIPRSAERNVNAIAEVRGIDLPPIRFERVALNSDQIRRFKPPPFPAKETSSRYASYVAEHGLKDAWELDALRPDVLTKLITDSVAVHFDETIHDDNRELVAERRVAMKARMRKRGWLTGALQ